MTRPPPPQRAAFANRAQAGRELARAVQALLLHAPVVVALPRGGVPVAVEVARALHAPLDVLLVRKIGAPLQPELAVAAVAEARAPATGTHLVTLARTMAAAGASANYVAQERGAQAREIERRRLRYGLTHERPSLAGAEIVLVDDGIATGTTVRAALQALRAAGVARIVLAVPVAPASAVAALASEVDDLVCLWQPEPFEAVGHHYRDFAQVDDDEVLRGLAAVTAVTAAAPPSSGT